MTPSSPLAPVKSPSPAKRWARALRRGAILALLLLAAILVGRSANSFLAANRPVQANVLIVEGWLPDSAMKGAIDEFRHGDYKYVITSGRVLPAAWLEKRFKSSAEFAAANLTAMGLDTNVIVAVPPPEGIIRDRTYASAVAIREWLKKEPSVHAVNIYSLGTHSRRTRLLFQKAFGNEISVGILSHPDNSYDGRRWWASADGFLAVTGEAVAYLYARLIFHPEQGSQAAKK